MGEERYMFLLDGQVGYLSLRTRVVVKMLVVGDSFNVPDVEETSCDCAFFGINLQACPVAV